MKCKYCNAVVTDGYMFCPNCGASVETPPLLRCPQCGTEAIGNIKFCPNCGSKMLEQRNCVMCGSPLVAGTQFCPQCGANQQVILQNSKQKVLNDVIREDMAIQKAEDTHPVKTVIAEESKPIEETDVRTDEKEDKVKEIKRDNEKEDNNESNSHVDESVENDNDTDSEYEEWEEEVHSSKRKYLIVGIAFIVALLGAGGWYYLSHHNKEVVVEEYADTQTISDGNNQNVSDEKVATENIDAGRPTFSQLSILYESIGENNSEQLFTQNGFQLVNTESKEGWDVYGDNIETYTMYKYTYVIRYNYAGNFGTMNVECVYSPTYGCPSMTIRCDRETWKSMKRLAESNLKDFGSNYFALDGKSLGFEDKNVITITSECSIPWGDEDIDDEEARLLSEMAARNIEREANRQELENEKTSNNDVANSENAPTLQMEGYIGEYRVIMFLNIRGSKAEGNYHYNNNSNKLYLNGDYNNGKLVLHETTDEGRPTGTFEGVLSGNEYSGEFVNYKGERFAFILQKKL